jgi:hypothetical protein
MQELHKGYLLVESGNKVGSGNYKMAIVSTSHLQKEHRTGKSFRLGCLRTSKPCQKFKEIHQFFKGLPHMSPVSPNPLVTFSSKYNLKRPLKGIVQRELPGVKTRLKQCTLINYLVGNIYFFN